MAKTITAKKRNPQDATLRNINALKKRVDAIEKTLHRLGVSVKGWQ